ncbi:MAG: formylglycine-generating enzyme family protein [Myxococcota bacterium]|jgi:sulfatase modifying factor 1
MATLIALAAAACGSASSGGGGVATGTATLGKPCASTTDCVGELQCIELKCTEVDAGAADTSADTSASDDVADSDATEPPPGMVLIPAGTFWMGCNAAKDNDCTEKPQHKVTLSAYYMDVTETTVGQYKACVDAKVCTAPGSVQPTPAATYPGLTNNPVNNVSWTQSQAYCKWRGPDYDLPTEAQWEMAARGSCEKNGSTAGDATCAAAMRKYPWGEALATCSHAVMSDGTNTGCGTGLTWAVGQKTAGDSPYGLHDMAGNVWEWNRDWLVSYSSGDQTDPEGPSSASIRVYRGGSFFEDAGYLRSSHRRGDYPSNDSDYLGLRCMKTFP